MLSRRHFLLAGAGVGVAALALNRPRLNDAGHTNYFAAINASLRAAGVDRPVLLIDLDRLDRNIDRLSQALSKGKHTYRIVVKSLPAPDLVEYVAARANTNSAMVFHRPFIEAMARLRNRSDLLLGKPMPVASVARFYEFHHGEFDPAKQLTWLIDTQERLAQYRELAQSRELRLRIALEIDVGLHRGGFASPQALVPALQYIADHPDQLEMAGFMGYDAHLGAMPEFLAQREVPALKARYQGFIDLLRNHFPALAQGPLIFNGAGSLSFTHYTSQSPLNDLAVGSALLKPSRFDLPSLSDFEPAAFIATPLLKRQASQGLPALEFLQGLHTLWNTNSADTLFTYGGNWLADMHSPPGLQRIAAYTSSNQEGYYAASRLPLAVDDFVFLRPQQSESVLLQFGDLIALRGTQIEKRWPVLPIST